MCFRPKFILLKDAGAANSWLMYDAARNEYNQLDRYLQANTNAVETQSAAYELDFLSNGLKLRDGSAALNTSGRNHVCIAFAENPFKYANAR